MLTRSISLKDIPYDRFDIVLMRDGDVFSRYEGLTVSDMALIVPHDPDAVETMQIIERLD